MSQLMLIPLPDGRWLALTEEAFAQALAAGSAAMPVHQDRSTSVTNASDQLLTAEQMEERTSVPASWWLKAARERRVPHVLIGKYPRFRHSECTASFEQPAVGATTNGYRSRRSA
jgi:hypothetical protein